MCISPTYEGSATSPGGPSGAPASPLPPSGTTPGGVPPVAPTSTPGVPPPPLPPSRRKPWALVGGGVAAVVVVILAVLFATGVFSSSSGGSSTGPTGTPLSYDQVVPTAQNVAYYASAGPWTLAVAEGVGISSAVSGPNIAGAVGGGCTATPVTNAPSSLTLLATPSNATPGTVADRIFYATNSAATQVLLIVVNASAGAAFVVVTGCSEVATFATYSPIGSAGVVDSTAVATSFDQAGGSNFSSSHSVSTRLFDLFGASSATHGNPAWAVAYSTCAFSATSGTGEELMGAYDASTGTAIELPSPFAQNC